MSDRVMNFKICLSAGLICCVLGGVFLYMVRDIPILHKLISGMWPVFVITPILFFILAFVSYLGVRPELQSMREVKIVQKTLKGHRVDQSFVELVRQDNGLTTATAYGNNNAAMVTMQLRNGKLINTQFLGDE